MCYLSKDAEKQLTSNIKHVGSFRATPSLDDSSFIAIGAVLHFCHINVYLLTLKHLLKIFMLYFLLYIILSILNKSYFSIVYTEFRLFIFRH